MLNRILAYGGRPVATNSLPAVGDEWKYVQDKYGVGLVFPASRYSAVEAFLIATLGPKPSKPGWGVRDVGVAVLLGQKDDETLVGIHPPNLGMKE